MADPHITWLERHALKILYSLYSIAQLLMLSIIIAFILYTRVSAGHVAGFMDAHDNYELEYSLSMAAFFFTTNGLLFFRVFTVNVIVLVLHSMFHLTAVSCLVAQAVLFYNSGPRSFFTVFQVPTIILLSVYILEIIMAIELVLFASKRSPERQEELAIIHAFTGLIPLTPQLWNVLLNIAMMCSSSNMVEPMIMAGLVLLYSLVVLLILLTPYFEAEHREEIIIAQQEEERLKKRAQQIKHELYGSPKK